jgi:metal-sulfur cluster biosynthetic enzyme
MLRSASSPAPASKSSSRSVDENKPAIFSWSLVPGPDPYSWPLALTMPTSEAIRKAIRAVKDPELNLNIIDIGLVYEVDVDDAGAVHIQMTLTSPGCPAGTEIIEDVKRVVGEMEGVKSVDVELVWDPYWTPEKMDPRVRTFLGF